MTVSLIGGLYGVGIAITVALCWLGYRTARTWDEPGATPFAAVMVLMGIGGFGGGVGTLVVGPSLGDATLWSQVGVAFFLLWCVPWALFGLQYTGRYTKVRPRTVGLLLAPYLGFLLLVGLQLATDIDLRVVDPLLGGAVFIYFFGLLSLGLYLVLQTTTVYDHLSLSQGLALALAPISNFLLINTSTTVPVDESPVGTAALYVAAFAIPAIAFAVALYRYRTFDSTPAVGTIGERAIVRETDDLVFIVDRRDRVVKRNRAANDAIDADRTDSLGVALSELLGHDSDELRELQTVTIRTTDGARRYDPQVSTITDQHDRELGSMLSLRDVTDRELREQRLTVLHRVLRHNLRNTVEVIRSHAELLDETDADGHAETIIEATDEIAALGRNARTVDELVSDRPAGTTVDLCEVVREVLEAADVDARGVTVSLDLPGSARLVTRGNAVTLALENAIDNALQYADATVRIAVEERPDGYRVTVADDGPGIPEAEREAIDRGGETPLRHGTGLGLWQLQWSVTTLNGELSFETTDGTTVELTLPDLGEDEDST